MSRVVEGLRGDAAARQVREAAEAVRRGNPCLPPGTEWSVLHLETGEVRRVRVAEDGSLLVGEPLPVPALVRPGE